MFYRMNILKAGTVVGTGFDKEGRTISDTIVHVDPNNTAEKGRYSNPIVTEDVKRKLEMNKFAEVAEEVDEADVILWMRGLDKGLASLITADTEAKRFKGVQKAEGTIDPTTNLSTRETVNFPNRDQVSGGDAGLVQHSDDDDAAPAPGGEGGGEGATGTEGTDGGASTGTATTGSTKSTKAAKAASAS